MYLIEIEITMQISINDLKRQINIELDYTDDDIFLQHLLDASTSAVETYLGVNALTGYTGFEVSGYTSNVPVPTEIIQSIVMLAAHLYLNRNIVSFGIGTEIPYSFKFLLGPYKDYVIQ